MEVLTALDLEENIAALAIAILRNDVVISDDAFKLLDKKFKEKQKKREKGIQEQVYEMRIAGMSYKEIVNLTGLRLKTAHTYFNRERIER